MQRKSQNKPSLMDSWLKPSTSRPSATAVEVASSSEAPTVVLMDQTEDLMVEEALNSTPDNNSRTHSVHEKQEIVVQNVPSAEFVFPRSSGRACQLSWFETYRWLHYNVTEDCVLCFTCLEADKLNGLNSAKRRDTSFLSIGFRNWKKGPERLEAHAKSSLHCQASAFLLQRRKGVPVCDLIVKQSEEQQLQSRTSMLAVLSSIRYLARTGQALRGSGHDEGNLNVLLEERSGNVGQPSLKAWMERRDNYTDGKIQNEILEIMAHSVQRCLVDEIKKSRFFGVICDGTTDVSGKEQLSLCIR